jgi:hypothetical protein
MSPLLTHFCGRSRPQKALPDGINAMRPEQRLANILLEDRLRAFQTFSGGEPVVCLTEATVNGLNFLVRQRDYAPWGLVFDRQSVYDVGGSPVWYARTDEYRLVRATGSPRIQSRLVRLEAENSDWLEEREWRVPAQNLESAQPAVALESLSLYAILIGNLDWAPYRRTQAHATSGHFGPVLHLPRAVHGVRRWWWDAQLTEFRELPPLT